jgi:formylglycine-generating enzyme required for sulfatase activity
MKLLIIFCTAGLLVLLAGCDRSATGNITPICQKIGQVWTSPVDGMLLVCIPAGEFTQGSTANDPLADTNEQPQHLVYIDAFWIDRTEVTNAMFTQCVAAGACHKRDISPYLWGVTLPSGTPYYGEDRFQDYPAIVLDSNEAQAYCQWAGRRLPSESEWEKAARGMDARAYPWGSGLECNQANFLGCLSMPAPADSYPQSASPYGALNMAGNLWEWTADWYDPVYYAQAPSQNPHGPKTGQYHTLRGGGWRSLSYQLRVANRSSGKPEHATDGEIGFRCAWDAPKP